MYGCHLLQRQTFLHTYCGPSRFSVSLNLLIGGDIFERGEPEEILPDNDAIFCSRQAVLDEWEVRLRLRCTYVPSGNGYSREVPPECEDDRGQEAAYRFKRNCTSQRYLHMPTSHSDPAMRRYTDYTTLELKPPNSQCTTSFRKGRVTT